MKTFLKILNGFFVFLGVVFFIIILFSAYFFWKDPFNLRPIISGLSGISKNISGDQTDKHPLLSPSQEAALEALGVDPAKLPTEITPEMEKCLVEKLVAEIVMEIKKTGSPSAADILAGKDCIN